MWLIDDYYIPQLLYLQSTGGKVEGAEGRTDVPDTWQKTTTIMLLQSQ